MRTISKLFAIGLTFMSALFTACGTEPIRGVIITGQNNHNWPVSHKAIKMTLENSGLFKMDVAVGGRGHVRLRCGFQQVQVCLSGL